MASVTGVYGISFWLASLNVLLYMLFAFTAARPRESGTGRAWVLALSAVLLYAVPYAATRWLVPGPEAGKAGERQALSHCHPA